VRRLVPGIGTTSSPAGHDPGEGDLRRLAAFILGQRFDGVHQSQIAAEIRVGETRRGAAGIVGGKVLRIFDATGEEAPAERRISHETDAELTQGRQDLVLDIGASQRIFRL
jgi:hypothetical protein